MVSIPNVTSANTGKGSTKQVCIPNVKSYEQYECIPVGKITRCDRNLILSKVNKKHECIPTGKITKSGDLDNLKGYKNLQCPNW